jgi:Na+(H+)/acetate symporter ActP
VATAEQVDAPSTVTMVVNGVIDGHHYRDQTVTLEPGVHQIGDGARLTLAKGAVVPHVTSTPGLSNDNWSTLLPAGGRAHPLYITYSLMIALFLGTMGLPHVVVRFYTNPNGRTARRTTLVVLGLLAVFYLMPPVYAALGRLYAADALLTGQTDALPLLLPSRLVSGVLGQMLSALLAAGAFAAFLSTSSGLVVSVAGVISQDVLRAPGSVRAFRFAAVVSAAVPFGMMLLVPGQSLANVVGLAFAVAASSFCPLLVLGIWWRGLTSVGATTGAIVGGGSALVAGGMTLVGGVGQGWVRTLLDYPAAWTVPLGFGTMIVLSLLTPGRTPPGVDRLMTHLHLPESLGMRSGERG